MMLEVITRFRHARLIESIRSVEKLSNQSYTGGRSVMLVHDQSRFRRIDNRNDQRAVSYGIMKYSVFLGLLQLLMM